MATGRGPPCVQAPHTQRDSEAWAMGLGFTAINITLHGLYTNVTGYLCLSMVAQKKRNSHSSDIFRSWDM